MLINIQFKEYSKTFIRRNWEVQSWISCLVIVERKDRTWKGKAFKRPWCQSFGTLETYLINKVTREFKPTKDVIIQKED